MSTATATETPAATFNIKETSAGEFTITVTTVAGTSDVRDPRTGSIRFYKTRSSARGALARYRSGLQK